MNEHSLIPEQRAAHASQYIQDGLAIGMLFLLVGKAHPDCKPADGAAKYFATDRDRRRH